MKERSYILVANLTRLRVVESIINSVVWIDEGDEAHIATVRLHLRDEIERLEKRVRVKE